MNPVQEKELNMVAVLLIGWVAVIFVSYKVSLSILEKTGHL